MEYTNCLTHAVFEKTVHEGVAVYFDDPISDHTIKKLMAQEVMSDRICIIIGNMASAIVSLNYASLLDKVFNHIKATLSCCYMDDCPSINVLDFQMPAHVFHHLACLHIIVERSPIETHVVFREVPL